MLSCLQPFFLLPGLLMLSVLLSHFFFQAEDGIRDTSVTGVQTCALPISLALRERIGAIDAATLASADLGPVFRERPAIHRFPGSMAQRVHDLAVHVRDRYDGDAARVWTEAADSDELRAKPRRAARLRRDE